MSRTSARSISVELSFFTTPRDRIGDLACRDCRSPLDIHQPSPTQPDQFLGTCPECDRWFRIEAVEDEPRAVVVRLPGIREVITPRRAASGIEDGK